MFKKLKKNFDKETKKLDNALGNPSHLNSSIPEKRKEKENKYKEVLNKLGSVSIHTVTKEESYEETHTEVVINSTTEVKQTFSNYIIETIRKISNEDNNILIKQQACHLALTEKNDSALAALIVELGHTDLNKAVSDWIINHSSENINLESLKLLGTEYCKKHQNETDVAMAVVLKSTNIHTLIEAFFATNHPELTSEVTEYMLLGESLLGEIQAFVTEDL
jgi:hypothetical protein